MRYEIRRNSLSFVEEAGPEGSGRGAAFVLALALSVFLGGSYVWAAPDIPITSADEPAAEVGGDEAVEEAASEASEEAEEIEWLVDDQGREYHVFEVEKGVEGRDWMWIDENRVQLRYGLQFDVVEHDDFVFFLKRIKPVRYADIPRKAKAKGPTESQLVEAAKTYDSGVEDVDRLLLKPFDRGLPRRGQWRDGFDVADMNGDGHPDIVFGPARKSSPWPNIFLGDGTGQWRVWREAKFPRFPYDYGDAAVADFNNDGHQDLALGMHLKGIMVLVGDGAGKFEAWSNGIGLEIPGEGGDATTFSSKALEVVDWNGDGHTDLLALGEGPKGLRLAVEGRGELTTANGPIFFLNNGDGTWRPIGKPSRVFGDSLALGDFDDDGRNDFVTASNAIGLTGLVNLARGAENWQTVSLTAARPKAFVRAVTSGHLNGDKVEDLVVGYVNREHGLWRSGVDVLYTEPGPGWFRRALFAKETRYGIYSVATGDLDGNGQTDIALGTGYGEIEIFLAHEGFYVHEVSPEVPAAVPGCRNFALGMADLNGDGRDELIAGFAGEQSGLPGLMSDPGCKGEGSLRVWSPEPVTEASPVASAP